MEALSESKGFCIDKVGHTKVTPIKCLNLGDTSGQLKLEGWLCNVFILYTIFNEETPF